MKRGDIAPDFTLLDERGAERSLRQLLTAGPLVLFFYPIAMSSGCTAEACAFRDARDDFARFGAQRVGISRDRVERQQEFATKHSFGYPLLSDRDGTIARAYGVRRALGVLPNKRWTFVIGKDGRIIEIIKSEAHMRAHADGALRALEANTA